MTGEHGRIKYCFSCGEVVVTGAAYCAQCGTDLIGASRTRTSAVYAGFWQRAGAFLLDMLIVFAVALLPGGILGALFGYAVYDSQKPFFTTFAEEQAIDDGIIVGLYTYIGIAYLIAAIYWTIGNATGATWGKKALDIRVVKDADGSEPRLGSGFLRWLIAWIVSPSIFYLGFLWMLWDSKKQTWHDKVTGTVVVKEGRPHPGSDTGSTPARRSLHA